MLSLQTGLQRQRRRWGPGPAHGGPREGGCLGFVPGDRRSAWPAPKDAACFPGAVRITLHNGWEHVAKMKANGVRGPESASTGLIASVCEHRPVSLAIIPEGVRGGRWLSRGPQESAVEH